MTRADGWACWNRFRLDVTRPGEPVGNAHVEAFHVTLRQECLSQHRFLDLEDARQTLGLRGTDCNNHRAHSSLGHMPSTD